MRVTAANPMGDHLTNMERFYPTRDSEPTVLTRLITPDPDYLDKPTCACDGEVKSILRGGGSASIEDVLTINNVENEAQRLYKELSEYDENLDVKIATRQILCFLRLVT